MASAGGQRLSRQDFKKQKELEELRKSGAAPAQLDEDGNMINPHIPQYISEAPWYLNAAAPGLKHQRAFKEPPHWASDWYRRGVKTHQAAKYRKGACTNCGAMTHKAKDCIERPRKAGAKWTNNDIAADELIQTLEHSYAAKHDRWNGYDGSEQTRLLQHYEKIDDERRRQKEAELNKEYASKKRKRTGDDEDSESDVDESDSDDEKKDSGTVIQKIDTDTRTTVRNLRIREDAAKYLRNLSSKAFYDPKTRSMRENPFPNQNPNEVAYAGDNFLRASGNAKEHAKMELFAWQQNDKGVDINLQATPSQAEMIYHQQMVKKESQKDSVKQQILQKYGGEEHFHAPDRELLLSQSEQYVEYAADGTVLKGAEAAIPKSKYIEDVYENGHTSVWGSWYNDGKWGFDCCKQCIRQAYCIGKA